MNENGIFYYLLFSLCCAFNSKQNYKYKCDANEECTSKDTGISGIKVSLLSNLYLIEHIIFYIVSWKFKRGWVLLSLEIYRAFENTLHF